MVWQRAGQHQAIQSRVPEKDKKDSWLKIKNGIPCPPKRGRPRESGDKWGQGGTNPFVPGTFPTKAVNVQNFQACCVKEVAPILLVLTELCMIKIYYIIKPK